MVTTQLCSRGKHGVRFVLSTDILYRLIAETCHVRPHLAATAYSGQPRTNRPPDVPPCRGSHVPSPQQEGRAWLQTKIWSLRSERRRDGQQIHGGWTYRWEGHGHAVTSSGRHKKLWLYPFYCNYDKRGTSYKELCLTRTGSETGNCEDNIFCRCFEPATNGWYQIIFCSF